MTVVHARVFCLIPAFAALAVGFEQKRYNAISSQDLAAQLGLKTSILCVKVNSSWMAPSQLLSTVAFSLEGQDASEVDITHWLTLVTF